MPTTRYIYNPLTEAYLMEQDGDGNTTVVYTQEPVKYGDVLAQHRIDPATGVGESYYYHTDALGSTRELTDSSGTVVNTYTYDAFGNTIASTGTVKNPFRFTGNVGYYFDEELDTYHIRARNYQPTIGRWISQDPLLFVDGANLYEAYFIPFGIDPSGTDWFDGYGEYPYTPPIGKPTGEYCGILTWACGKCCTPNQIADTKSHCESKGQRLNSCTNDKGKRIGLVIFTCRDKTVDDCVDDCERVKDNVCDPKCRKMPDGTKKQKELKALCWEGCAEEYSLCIRDCNRK